MISRSSSIDELRDDSYGVFLNEKRQIADETMARAAERSSYLSVAWNRRTETLSSSII